MATATDIAPRQRRTAALLWICWTAWAVVLLFQYFVQLRSMIVVPRALIAFALLAIAQIFYCLAFTVPLTALVALAARSLVAIRERAGPVRRRVLWFATALLAYTWVRVSPALSDALAPMQFPHVPAFGEALARGLRGVGGSAIVTLAALAIGRAIVAAVRLHPASRLERMVIALTLGFGTLGMLSLGLAVIGLYRPPAISLLIIVALVSGALFDSSSAAQAHHAEDAATTRLRRPAAIEIGWLATAFTAASFALVAALAPEVEYDALWYHLYFPRLWLETGRVVDLVQEFPSLYPFTWDLVYGVGLVFGDVVAAKLLHFACLCVVAATVVLACRRYLRERSPYVALALVVTTPTLLWEATTAYNDLALAMFVSVAAYALARFVDTGNRAWFVIAAFEFGLAAATKHLALVALAVSGIVLMWVLWRRRMPPLQIVGTVATLGGMTIAIALPWYARAWLGSGNPFFPELSGLFGGGPPARWDGIAEQGLSNFKARFGFHDQPWALLRLPWDVTVHAARFSGSIGPLWLMLIPANFIVGERDRATRVLGFGVLAYLVVWASPVSSYQLRFLVPIVPALALIATDAWQRVTTTAARAGSKIGAATQLMLIAIACLNLPPFMALHEVDRVGYEGWLTHVLRKAPTGVVFGRESEERYLSREVPSYQAWQYANEHLPADSVVLTFSDGDNFYSERARIPYDSVLARPAVWTATSDGEVPAALARLGVEYVLFDKRKLPQLAAEHLPIAGSSFQQACVTEYEDRRYRLCNVVLPSRSGSSESGSAAGGG